MKRSKTFFFLVLLASTLTAILLIVMGPKWAEKWGRRFDPAPSAQPAAGELSSTEGNISRRRYGETRFTEWRTGGTLYHLDTVQIQSRGKAQFTLGGHKFNLFGPALVVVELWNNSAPEGPVVLHLTSGQIVPVQDGKPGKLFILREGQMFDTKGAAIAHEQALIVSPLNLGEPPTSALPATTGSPTLSNGTKSGPDEDLDKNRLSNEYLDSEIAKEAEQFQRCQSNALRERAEVRGQILVGLTIASTGRIDEARVLSSTLQDEKLHSCVIQIFQRLKLKAFQGPSIVRSYPLNFE